MPFDAFISYSHAADGELAPALQNGLQRLAKPWTRRQALRIFRDDTGLSVSPGLWPSITAALDESQYFILMASPGAAQSEWVGREIEYWLASRPDAAERILPVLTDGTFVWSEDANDIDWAMSTAAPAALAGVFASEPRHLDLVWARTHDDLGLQNARFRDAVADLAAPIHGIPKDELESEDVRQHRKALLLRRSAVAGLVVLLIGLTIASVLALRSADTARAALKDLEDANGDISELEAEEARLNAANEAAEASLAATEESLAEAETAQAEAETARAAAEQQAEQADSARAESERLKAEAEQEAAEADAAREAAIEAQRIAEAARAEAEAAQRAAEQARINAQVAQFAAEMERDDAQSDAAEAQRLADEAERQAAAARRAEAAANAAKTAAEQAEANARAEQAEAEAAANAAERAADTARRAEADAKVAQQTAEDLQRQAEEAARVAADLQLLAENAARAASLAQASLEASDPALSALLAVESFCATDGCGASARTVERFTDSESEAGRTAGELEPWLRMLEITNEQQDYAGGLHGPSGRVVDAAISADGSVIAAVTSAGRLRVWHPGAPTGQEFDVGNVDGMIGSAACVACQEVTGVGVSQDGGTVVYTTRPSRPDDSITEGKEWLYYLDVATGAPQRRALIGCRRRNEQASRIEIDVHPSRSFVALLKVDRRIGRGEFSYPVDTRVLVVDPALDPVPEDPESVVCRPGYRGPMFHDAITIPHSDTAVWAADGTLITFGAGTASVVDLGASQLGFPVANLERFEVATDEPSEPTTSSYDGERFVIGTDTGRVAVFEGLPRQGQLWNASVQRDGAPAALSRVAVTRGASSVIAADADGVVHRIGLESSGPSASVIARSTRGAVDVDAGAEGSAAVIVVDGRMERRTVDLSWAGASVIRHATENVSVDGAIIADGVVHAVERPGGGASSRLPVEDSHRTVMSLDGRAVVLYPHDTSQPIVRRGETLQTVVPLEITYAEIPVPKAAISPEGAIVAIPTGSDRVQLFDGTTGEKTRAITVPEMCGRSQHIDQLLVSRHHVVVHAVSWPCNHDVLTLVFAFDHDGRQIGEPIDIFDENFPIVNVPKSLSEGPEAVLAYNDPKVDGVVRSLGLADGTLSTLFDVGINDTISALAIEPDGGHLAAVGYSSGRLELWDVRNGLPLIELSRHPGAISSVAIGVVGDALRVASIDRMGTAVTRVLDSPTELRRTVCTLAGRDLDADEWRQFVGDGEPLACRRGL